MQPSPTQKLLPKQRADVMGWRLPAPPPFFFNLEGLPCASVCLPGSPTATATAWGLRFLSCPRSSYVTIHSPQFRAVSEIQRGRASHPRSHRKMVTALHGGHLMKPGHGNLGPPQVKGKAGRHWFTLLWLGFLKPPGVKSLQVLHVQG